MMDRWEELINAATNQVMKRKLTDMLKFTDQFKIELRMDLRHIACASSYDVTAAFILNSQHGTQY